MAMDEQAWYVYISGETYGPVGLDELKAWYAEGRFSDADYIYGPGHNDWTPSLQVPLLHSPLLMPQTESEVITQLEEKKEDIKDKKEDETKTVKEKKPVNRKMIVYIVIAILLILGVSAVVFFLSKNNGDSSGDKYLNEIELDIHKPTDNTK